MPIDPSIALSFRPTQFPGFDLGNAAQGANALAQFQANQQKIQSQNALRSILSQPGAIDDQGNPTADALKKVNAVDPMTGMQLRDNMLVAQQKQLQMSVYKTEAFQKKNDMIYNAYGVIDKTYQDKVKAGLIPEQQAREEATREVQAVNADWAQGGGLSEEEARRLPTEFEPVGFKRYFDGSDRIREMVKTQSTIDERKRAEAREDAQLAETKRYHDIEAGKVSPAAAAERDVEAIAQNTIAEAEKAKGSPLSEAEKSQIRLDARNKAAGERKLVQGSPNAIRATIEGQLAVDPVWKYKTPAERALQAEKLYREASIAQPGLEGEALDRAAQRFHETLELPGGFGGQADREAIMKREAELFPEKGASLERAAEVKAARSSLVKLTGQADAAESYARTATREMDLAVKAIPKSAEPLNSQLLTRWVRSGETQFGDVDVPVYQAYLISSLEEYAKIMSGATGAQGSTDAARALALKMVPDGATSEQVPKIIEALKNGIANRTNSYQEQIEAIKRRISGKPDPDAAKPAEAKSGGGESSGGNSYPTPTPDDLKRLKADPDLAEQFDAQFGPGAAKRAAEEMLRNKGGGAPATGTPAGKSAAAPSGSGKTKDDPIAVTDPAAAMKLPPGTFFLAPDGKIRQRPMVSAPPASGPLA
jgi:hypothetical protein